MTRMCFGTPAVCAVLLGALPSGAVWPAEPTAAPARARDADALAATIDRHVSARWASLGVTPAAPADDAEFLRRVYLDLAGRTPGVTEARRFLDDARPDKRAKLIESLLESPTYANHFTNVWRALLMPE